MTRRLFVSLLFAATLALVPGVPAASAEALSPWWGITAGERPTDLRPGVARDEVQQITTSPEVAFELRVNKERVELNKNEGIFVTEPFFAAFGGFYPMANAANIQAALETVYGAGNVEVKGTGPSAAPPLTITTISEAADKTVPTVEVVALEGQAEANILTPGRADGQLIVTAQNRGDAGTSGEVTIQDTLPAGLEAVAVEGFSLINGGNSRGSATCPSKPRSLRSLACTFGVNPSVSLPPFEQIEMRIDVVANGAKTGALNSATVSGGGAAVGASASHPIVVEGGERFGLEDFQFVPEDAGGRIDTQAGSHPFQVTNVVTFNSAPPDAAQHPRSVGLPKDVSAELPAGSVGNPTPFAQCTDSQFARHPKNPESTAVLNECPAPSAIGVANISFSLPSNHSAHHLESSAVPIFNMVPRPGEPARFGFEVEGIVAVFLDTAVRTGSDYGVTVTASNITEVQWLLSSKLTFWGVPGDPRHDGQRGWECLERFGTCPHSVGTSPPPFLVMPTACGPFDTPGHADSWAASGEPSVQAEPVTSKLKGGQGESLSVDGCNHLPFAPEVRVTPDGTAASSPTGLNVDVHVPQDSVLHAESLAQSAVKNIEVALPEGVAINPSGGDGLQACTEGEIGFEGEEKASETLRFSAGLPEPFCPDASKIATVEIKTPLLPNPLRGAVYLATQNQNPFGSLITLYLVAEDPVSGTLVKLPGQTRLTASGQVVGVFANNPELPFEDAEIHFFGGERSPLSTPSRCGAYTTNATFAPWSGNEPVRSTSTFNITSGPNHSSCVYSGQTLPFSPSLTGGPTNINAGSFSPLTTTIGREDGQQNMQGVTLHFPPGLSGLLSGVKLCSEAQANEGACGPESLIGETTVSAGVGSDPVSVKGGRVYITEHYAGAPFGLSIVNPVKAGPFDLEHDTANPAQNPACDCVVVRAKIQVDPTTAALTITTDPSGAHAIPHLIDGIPVQIQKVNVLINRPGFTFNPTSCSPMSVTGAIGGVEGGSSPVSVPFQVTNCAVLKFAPKFQVSTSGRTSKANGASLAVKLSYPSAPFGSQANIRSVKVDLPKLLPSRLTTLQKACTAAQFNTNPAGCPVASFIGHARAFTPLLPVVLEGPAIFVSHGGEAFPSLEIVLQGYGVTIDLVGSTFISKAGITSSTFRTVPDQPVTSFELTLPEGPYSALAANGNLCTSTLAMPTEFVAQNGAMIAQSTPVSVTGCAKRKALTRAQKLAAALKVCRRDRNRVKRHSCERVARKRYGPLAKRKPKGRGKA